MSLLKLMVLEQTPVKQSTKACLQRFKRYTNSLRVCYGILMYDGDSVSLPVVPFPFLVELAVRMHWNTAHIGRHKLIYRIRQLCWHPSIDEVARDVTSSCPLCQLTKIGHQTVKPPTLKINTTKPFELIGMDCIQLPTTHDGYVGCLVVVDYYSKWLSVCPLKNKKAVTVAHALETVILQSLPRIPDRVHSDNGVEFRADPVNDILVKYGITHAYSTPYSILSYILWSRGTE
jgi:hypothetical protein